jgi:hypothetical protein
MRHFNDLPLIIRTMPPAFSTQSPIGLFGALKMARTLAFRRRQGHEKAAPGK